VLDLLAVDRSGRLGNHRTQGGGGSSSAPAGAGLLDSREWHLDRKEFSANGYFPVELRMEPPRLLVSPSLGFIHHERFWVFSHRNRVEQSGWR
jgi:hypothetical protein